MMIATLIFAASLSTSTGRVGQDAAGKPALRGTALLDELQHRAVRFFWNESDSKTGFAKDRAANFAESDNYTVASAASTGFALAAYTIGIQRRWLDRRAAHERTLNTLKSIKTTLEGTHGWYYHFVDWTTGKRMWNCEVSSIDSSIMFSGMIVAEQYWHDPEISGLSESILKAVDWQWMRSRGGLMPEDPFVSMGWKPEDGFINASWSAYDELPMIFVLGYGSDPQLAKYDGWDKVERKVVDYHGYEYFVGGPLFMHQMALNFYNFGEKRDRQGFNYWRSTQQATLGNRAYCIENPLHMKGYGANFWGLSACDTPEGYRALGAPADTHDNGTITPTSPIASMAYTPKESMEFAEAMYRDHPEAWGRYGFSNGVCPQQGWRGPDVIGIDLGMMLIGVENYRSGMIWKLTSSHPIVKAGFDRMGFRAAPGSNHGPLRSSG